MDIKEINARVVRRFRTGGDIEGMTRYGLPAVPLAGTDRDRQWSMLKQTYPFFADHEAKTSREIPWSR